jgi:plastocyanin
MVKPFVGRPFSWMLLVGLLIVVFALSACGGGSSTTTSSTTASPTTSASAAVSAVTITIREQTGGQDVYSFDPQSVTIKAGETVTFDNQSDEFHQLIITDAAGNPTTNTDPFTANTIVPTSRTGSTTTTLQVVFNKAGTYYYGSKLVQRPKDNNHPEGVLSQAKGTIIVK